MIEPKNEPYAFYKIDAGESLNIEKMDKQVELRENYIAAIVEGTLGQTFIDNNLNLKLISSIEEVLAWTVDLFDVSDGDRFKVLYDEEFVNGKSYKIDKVKALYFEKDGEDYYAFNNEKGDKEFYSELGQSMKRSFLATPIKYGGVITSGYGLRTHPVTGHTKEHLGTDFAAPEGTPIQAVADGTVTIAAFKSNNGNYVKLKHDKTYTTQYLHMQKWADNIRPGVKVRQGQVIGYVGSTGQSTGPHVCYRFWKNNKQEDPRAGNASSGGRIASREIQDYYKYIEPIKERIKEINYF
jgi:murein DD-endopeptidase MepM/ murein hydrolase activator NlpD